MSEVGKESAALTRRTILSVGTRAVAGSVGTFVGGEQIVTAKGLVQYQPTVTAVKQLVKVRAMKPGDRVGLVCPGGRPLNPSIVKRSVKLVEEMGFNPVVGKHALGIYGPMAGTDEQRLEDLRGFLHDQSISGIFCITGGYGSLHLVDKLDYDFIQQNPKVLIGSDDNCCWLLAVHARTGVAVMHGPNLDKISSKQAFDSFKFAVTCKGYLPPLEASYSEDDSGWKDPKKVKQGSEKGWEVKYSYAPVEGIAEGPLTGGNLTALSSLMGTPYQPRLSDCVLFLEDINQTNDILERWFTNLYVSGQLAQTKGVMLGDFVNCGARDCVNLLSLEDLFGDRLKAMVKPSIFGMPLGQSHRSATVPLGIKVRFDSATGSLEFLDNALVG